MRLVHGVRRPPAMRPAVWRAGLGLWGLALLVLAFLVVRSPIAADLAESSAQLASQVRTWAGKVIDARAPAAASPDFTLSRFDGATLHLSDYRGQVVVVNFWGSWCPPCQREAPRLEAVYQRYQPRGVVFTGIDVQDQEQDARAFIKQFQITYPNGQDGTEAIASVYGVTGLPTTVVIDRQGRIRQRWLGELQENQLTGIVEAALR